ncbi:hypothetical protein BS47DRAFT_233359 [Hydnum rufescens UP504]|uniref:Secreted protein n=1 Tax=Hydnum rufescens UP504 TaxID=1448309 RepID=A0A9P6AM34_9AGAM|nr:hypothetical protein BS47DRAFT_233359 [Hydnum rufescens UP504]
MGRLVPSIGFLVNTLRVTIFFMAFVQMCESHSCWPRQGGFKPVHWDALCRVPCSISLCSICKPPAISVTPRNDCEIVRIDSLSNAWFFFKTMSVSGAEAVVSRFVLLHRAR